MKFARHHQVRRPQHLELSSISVEDIPVPTAYPARCRIIDADGLRITDGVYARTPEESRPHVGKLGMAEMVHEPEQSYVRIILDDGTVLYGYECWWEPVHE